MLEKGSKLVKVSAPSRIVVQSDGEFAVYAMEGDFKVDVLGPSSASDRICVVDLVGELDGIFVSVKPSVRWSCRFLNLTDGKEYLDPTPVEIPVGYEKPLSLKQDMMRFIREEVSASADRNGADSFDESDDFDIGFEDEPVSDYEFAELQDDYEPEEVVVAPEEPPKKDPRKADPDPPPPSDPPDKPVVQPTVG